MSLRKSLKVAAVMSVTFLILQTSCSDLPNSSSFISTTAAFTVTVSGDTFETISPSTVQTVNSGSTQSFTVTASTGYTLSSTVGGTCPSGSWSGSTYTTGAITADCTVTFSAALTVYTVTASGTNVTFSPSAAQTITAGTTQAYVVTSASGYRSPSSIIGGTCAAGSWSGTTYTTGAITSDCTVIFKGSKNRIFLTTGTNNGNFSAVSGATSGINGADRLCESDSGKPSDSGATWKALFVDGTNRRACSTTNCSGGVSENIDWVLKAGADYVKASNEAALFTANSAGIYTGSLSTAIGGITVNVWTGFANSPSRDWTGSSDTCSGWTLDSSGGPAGAVGQSDVLTTSWFANGVLGCNLTQPIYCVEQ